MLTAAIGSQEVVMMSINAGCYYGLNSVGSRIWQLLESPQSLSQLCHQILDEFDVDAPTCEAEVRRFVAELLNNGILHESAA